MRTGNWLRARRVSFSEIDIDRDPGADAFVRFINGGFRSTPTLVFDEGNRKIVLTEPTDEELERELVRAGRG